jgi:hypothetical protein
MGRWENRDEGPRIPFPSFTGKWYLRAEDLHQPPSPDGMTMTTTDLYPTSTAGALERECASMGVTLKPSTPGLREAMTSLRSGARLCQPWNEPIIFWRDDLPLGQRAGHVRFLLARLREPWAGAALLQDPALALDSPEFA